MAELNIVGGHVALDLVNTVDPRASDRENYNEHLPTAQALLDWAARVHLLTTAETGQVTQAWSAENVGEQRLRATVEVREATYTIMLAELGVIDNADTALQLLHQHWVAAIGRSSLRLRPEKGLHQPDRLHVGTVPSHLIPDLLANAAVELLRTLDTRQLKACPVDEGGCGFLFLDRSHNRTRRWCSMEDCGARVKAQRLTERRRANRARSLTGHTRDVGGTKLSTPSV
jgi:predicted RNA-binding Zn ribbon-like protein